MAFQEDYYDIEKIKERLSNKLITDEWSNIKTTDVGQRILDYGAEIVHMLSIAFFSSVDEMFEVSANTVGYLEAIGKPLNIIPENFTSGSISIELKNISASQKSYPAMQFYVLIDGHTFYAIEPFSIDVGETKLIQFYQGTPVRYTTAYDEFQGAYSGYDIGYVEMPTPGEIVIGTQVVQKFIKLAYNTFLLSILVETADGAIDPRTKWAETDTFYSQDLNSYVYRKNIDYLGDYQVVFGDGVYGKAYPNQEVLFITFLLSDGNQAIPTDFTDLKFFNLDSEVTGYFSVESQSTFVEGLSAQDFNDYKKRIELKRVTRQNLVRIPDYENYLDGRPDVLFSKVQAERHVDPPDINMFNVIKVSIKPITSTSGYSITDMFAYFGEYGLETVEYSEESFIWQKFKLYIKVGILPDFDSVSVMSQIQSTLETEYDWNKLGYDEVLSVGSVIANFLSVDGWDHDNIIVYVQLLYTNPATGDNIFSFVPAEVVNLNTNYEISRGNICIKADEIEDNEGVACDNYNGEIRGQISSVPDTLIATVDYTTKIVTISVALTNASIYYKTPTGSVKALDFDLVVLDSVTVEEDI